MNNETLDGMTLNLVESLDKDELLNQKGITAIVKLIKQDATRATIRHAIKSTNGDKQQYADGLKALVALYDSSAAISVRALCEQAATEKTSRKFLEEKILPLLVEMGVIVKTGERSSQWQASDKIGRKPGILEHIKAAMVVTPEKQALRAAQDKAADEARLLNLAKKQAAIATHRKTTLMQAANAAQEAERVAATLPTGESGAAGWARQNPGLLAVIGLALIVAVGGQMSGESVTGNQVQVASVPTLTASIQESGK